MFHVMLSEILVSLIASIIICFTFAAFPSFAVIVTLVRLLQPSNAVSPMLVTLSGIVTLVKLSHKANDSVPMLVTLFGIVTFVK